MTYDVHCVKGQTLATLPGQTLATLPPCRTCSSRMCAGRFRLTREVSMLSGSTKLSSSSLSMGKALPMLREGRHSLLRELLFW